MEDALPKNAAIGVSLGLTLLLGLILRAFLAGSGWLPGDFRHLRHAHTHLGWYGALFPLLFTALQHRKLWVPGPRAMAVYWLAVAVSTVGFVRAGYGIDAIAGSTAVLAVWLTLAWKNRRLLALRRTDWLAAVPVLLPLAALSIPPVAVTLRRDPALAARWVQTFLSLLLFGSVLPVALDRGRLRAPPGGMWLLATLGAAAWFGVVGGLWLQPAVVLLGGLLVGSAWVSRLARLDLRVLTGLMGGGLVAVGTGLVSADPAMAVAGIHLAVLGPVLVGLTGAGGRPGALSWLSHGALLLMCGAIATTPHLPAWPLPMVAAVSAVPVAAGALWTLARRTPEP